MRMPTENERYQFIKGGPKHQINYIFDKQTGMVVTGISEGPGNEDLRRMLYFANRGNRGTRGAW